MKKLTFFLTLFASALNALAGVAASITCVPEPVPGLAASYPVVSVSYSPGNDAGVPGLIYFGALEPGGQGGAVLTPGKVWQAYKGGSYPFYEKYLTGLPGSISFSIGLPNGSMTTAAYVDYELYAGHGAYTKEHVANVQNMLKQQNETKAMLSKMGAWSSELESGMISEMHMIQAAVELDFIKYRKGAKLLTIPYIDCTPPPFYFNNN